MAKQYGTGNTYKKSILLKDDFLKNYWAIFAHTLGIYSSPS
jgi:hypothetical protein